MLSSTINNSFLNILARFFVAEKERKISLVKRSVLNFHRFSFVYTRNPGPEHGLALYPVYTILKLAWRAGTMFARSCKRDITVSTACRKLWIRHNTRFANQPLRGFFIKSQQTTDSLASNNCQPWNPRRWPTAIKWTVSAVRQYAEAFHIIKRAFDLTQRMQQST